MRRQQFVIILAGLAMSVGLAACDGANGTDTPGTSPPVPDAMPGTGQADAALSRAASLALTCSGCHGEADDAIISLSGLSGDTLEQALMRYKRETDGTTVMHRLMRGYGDADIAAVSAHISGEIEQ